MKTWMPTCMYFDWPYFQDTISCVIYCVIESLNVYETIKISAGRYIMLISLLPGPHPPCSTVIENDIDYSNLQVGCQQKENSQFVPLSAESTTYRSLITDWTDSQQSRLFLLNCDNQLVHTHSSNLAPHMYSHVDDHSQLVLQSHNQYYSKIQLRELYWGDQTKMFAHSNYQKPIYHTVSTLNDIVICSYKIQQYLNASTLKVNLHTIISAQAYANNDPDHTDPTECVHTPCKESHYRNHSSHRYLALRTTSRSKPDQTIPAICLELGNSQRYCFQECDRQGSLPSCLVRSIHLSCLHLDSYDVSWLSGRSKTFRWLHLFWDCSLDSCMDDRENWVQLCRVRLVQYCSGPLLLASI